MKRRSAEAIFLDLAGRTGADRESLLRQACGEDPDLRAEVERLEAAVGEFDVHVRAAIQVEASFAETRRRIGPYRVLRRLGHGGMGTVYLAVRDDDEYKKEVAIKVARASLTDGFSQARFRHERQILAALEHPNIARMLEGGTTQDGEPYIVMEYVDGVAITSFPASQAEKLRIFQKVASAVAYAHRHLVIHRDIKPSNILVAQGEPKLLDFGIAKVLDSSTAQNWTNTALMTRDYSSPEQLEGRIVTVLSDVYSLGLVLCELLTGRRDASRLDGDLRVVASKAINLEPDQRYHSVREFGEDVERFLAGHPVAARPLTASYQLRRFLGRHKAAAGIAALLILAAGAGWWSTVRQSRRAQMRLTQVRQMANAMIFDIHDQIKPLPGSIAARASVVETAQRYLASLEGDAAADPAVAIEIAAGYERLGDLQGGVEMASIGRVGAAVESYRRALALRERFISGALALRDLSRVQVKTANALAQGGASAEAFGLLEKSVNSANAAWRMQPADAANGSALIEAEYRLGDWLLRKGRASSALPHARNALSVARQTGGGVSTALRRYGDAAHQSGQLTEAAAAYREATEAWTREGHTQDREWMLLKLAQGNVLGNPLFLNLGNSLEACASYQEALRWAQSRWDDDPANAGARSDYVTVLSRLASVYWTLDPAESIRLYDRSISHREQLSRGAPENVEFLRGLAYDLANSAVPLRLLGRADEGARRARRALELDSEMVRRDPVRVQCCSDVPWYSIVLGDAQRALGQRNEAGQSFHRAADVAGSYGVRDTCGVFCTKDWAAALDRVSAWESAMGRPEEASRWASRARAVWADWIRKHGANVDIEKRLAAVGSPLR